MLVVLFLCISAQGNSSLFSKIKFIGNRFIKKPEKLFTIQPNSYISDSTLQVWQDSLLSVYARNGFFWARIIIDTIKSKNQTTFKFTIQENERAKIKKVELNGNENFSLSRLSPLIENNLYFSDQLLNSQTKSLLNFYADNGFPFSTIEAQNFILDDKEKTISYHFKIVEGPKVVINRIKFAGNQTKEYRLCQISGLRTQTNYNETEIKKYLSRINTQGIKIIDYNIVKTDTTYALQIDIEEGKFQEISGAISYLPNYRELNGFLYLNLNNLFYTLRKLNLGWESYAHFSNFSVNYTDPWLLGFILNSDFSYIVYDTFYAKVNFNIGATIPVLDYLALGFSSGYEILNSGLVGLANYKTYWLGQSANFEINKNIKPSYTLELNTEFGTRKSQRNQLLIIADLRNRLLLPFIRHTNFSFDWRLKNMYSNAELTMADSMYLGGTKSLRGYRENEFSTTRFLLACNELNIMSTKLTNFFLFTDIAYFRKINDYDAKLGYGIGLRTTTKIGTIGIDYGIPADNNLLQGKIHLNFNSKF